MLANALGEKDRMIGGKSTLAGLALLAWHSRPPYIYKSVGERVITG